MKRVPDWLIYLVVLSLFVYNAMQQKREIATPIAPGELGEILPSQSPRDERVMVTVDAPQSGIGTAFAIDTKGTWMTARHVVDSCEDVGIKVGRSKILRTTVQINEDADLAILNSSWARRPLPPDVNSDRRIGETGFFFGFPQGRPGEVVGSLLGRGRMMVRGRYRSDEGVLAWSELGRTRGLFGSLGGLSGSPVLDSDGEVIGVVSAESPRRGRVYTVAPLYLRRYFGATSTTAAAEALSVDTYGVQADRLRRDRRVAQVICLVN
ncbi:serine protease [Litorimonas sp. RW-G-Af-16]|uniref:S1 family peptidase n=1 Tax=Litorimonas sp. RW-G-Af-16 TaxID=3241168 RepID=UPI00390C81CC